MSFGGRGDRGSKEPEDEDLMENKSSLSGEKASHSVSAGIWAAQAQMPSSLVPWKV